LILVVDHDKRSARFHGLYEEDFEHSFLVAVALRMLFPDERVRCDGEKSVPIFRRERTKLHELAFQMWPKIK